MVEPFCVFVLSDENSRDLTWVTKQKPMDFIREKTDQGQGRVC